LVYADNINILAENIGTMKKNKEALLKASREIGLQVKSEETECMIVSHCQNARTK
jgi:hypothetical protein